MKRYVVIDAGGEYRFDTDSMAIATYQEALSLCELSYQRYGDLFPKEYPFTIREIEVET